MTGPFGTIWNDETNCNAIRTNVGPPYIRKLPSLPAE